MVELGATFLIKQLSNRRAVLRMPTFQMSSKNSEGTTVCPQSIDIKNMKTVCGEYLLHREKRKIRKMLMINGIELVVPHEAQKMGEFHGDHAIVGQKNLETSNKIIQSGNVS